ncbi:MAG: DegV family protein [Dermatophilaceae bacterium]
MGVAIVTDSTAYLRPEQVEQARAPIHVVPLHVVIGGQQCREGVDVSVEDLAAALRAFRPVTTSMPAPRDFLEVYESAVGQGADEIVSVHLSAEMSGTVTGARLAAQQAPVPVHVVDSRTLGMAMGYAVLSAAEAAAAGRSGDECAQVARSRAGASLLVFCVDTLEYLRRGGRIGSASALLGSALAIKPILALTDGHIEPVEKVRTASRAMARLADLAVAFAEQTQAPVDVTVQHLDSATRAQSVVEALRARLPAAREVALGELGAVIGAHVGPGTLAVVVSPVVAL